MMDNYFSVEITYYKNGKILANKHNEPINEFNLQVVPRIAAQLFQEIKIELGEDDD